MPAWNRIFTDLIRRSRPGLWGNWALDPSIVPGAYGILNEAGEFTLLGNIQNPDPVIPQGQPQSTWDLSSESVDERQGSLTGGASVPTSAATVNVNFEISWKFNKSESITSQFAIDSESRLNDPTAVIGNNRVALQQAAVATGMLPGGEIAQGFGVITRTIQARSGLNLGAYRQGAEFGLRGDADAVLATIGRGNVAAQYASTHQTGSLDKHLWPNEPGPAAGADTLPVAFSFASFVNGAVVPTWIRHIGALELHIKNTGSYIADCTVSYNSNAAPHQFTARVTGGVSRVLTLPLDATDVTLSIDCVAEGGPAHEHAWSAPLTQWLGGRCHVQIDGLWPWGTHEHITPY